jgi:hypothetical protein
MALKETITDIVTKLSSWAEAGLNEAQTSQAIILRILESLGYDIFNPLEVFAQQNSGGGLGGYIPDFTIIFNDNNCFIIEVKPLGKKFNNNNRTQAVNYVNSMGLRWAVLTNGIDWLFFDNKQEGVAAEKLAATLNIMDIQVADYLEQLLSPEVWKQSTADQQVEQTIQLINVESKLRQIMSRGFSHDEYGLQLAIEFKLTPEERQVAHSHFETLLGRIFFLPAALKGTLSAIDTMEPLDESKVLQWLAEQMEHSSLQYSTIKKNINLKINGLQVEVKNWQDIYHGLVETLLFVNKEEEISFLFKKAANLKNFDDKKHYRPLSNQKYLRVGLRIKDVQESMNELLNLLPISKGSLEVIQRGKIYHFPY